jgi:phage host-nuclease inhibitor protein Gam
VPQFFLPVRSEPPEGSSLLYRPAVLGCGQVYFQDAKADISYAVPVALLAPISSGAVTIDWPGAARVEVTPEDLESEPAEGARFEAFPPAAAKAKSYTAWTKAYVDALYRGMTLKIFKSPSLGAWSKPTESERNFRVRLQQEGREARDDEIARIRAKYAPKLATLEEKIRRAEQAVEREAAQARTSGFSSVIRLGSTILGAVMGRKTLSSSTISKAGTTLRTASQTMKETGDVGRAKETVESLRKQYAELDAKLQAEIEGLAKEIEPLTEVLETVALRPKKSNITTKLVALVWRPYWSGPDGTTNSAWDSPAKPSGPQAP